MADQEMIDKVKAELTRLIEPAVNPKAPYAVVMLDEMAIAAIQAMREPTEKMLIAGCDVGPDRSPDEYWQSMIDAVLND